MSELSATNAIRISKFLSLVLRHEPEKIDIVLDKNGWCDVGELLHKMQAKFPLFTMENLEHIVDTNSKKRFAFNDTKTKIRANQGHSVDVHLDLQPQAPPPVLYHGTTTKALDSILQVGLKKMQRHHVHLATNVDVTMEVARRYGKPVLLKIDASAMYDDGHVFYCTENNVWLTDAVPSDYITVCNSEKMERDSSLNNYGANSSNRRKSIAHETMEIVKQGKYRVSSQVITISELVEYSVQHTHTYTPLQLDNILSTRVHSSNSNTSIKVTSEDTLQCVKRLISEGEDNILCLNFASAKNPGGGFLNGANAQEESLCRSSSLYNSISSQHQYYQANKHHSTCLYTDYLIYSPNVMVFRDSSGGLLFEPYTVSVITSPAVNSGVVRLREPENIDSIESTMRRRIANVLAVAEHHKHTTLVLGAWGCGVFQNNPRHIAQWFLEAIQLQFEGVFKNILFAVFDSSKDKYVLSAFIDVFNPIP